MFTIYSNGDISSNKDGSTGFHVFQASDRTVVKNRKTGEELAMPSQRYALSCDNPASGNPGREQFIKDFAAAYDLSRI